MKKLVLALLIFLPAIANAQGYRGRDFWIAFPQNAINDHNNYLSFKVFICAEQRTTGTIVNLATGDTQKFSLEYGSEIERDIDTAVELKTNELTEQKSVHITSDADISVYVLSHRPASTDSYMAIPTDKLGTEYIEAGYSTLKNGAEHFASQMAIVATEDNTLATIHLKGRSMLNDSGRNIAVPMQRGQTFLVQGNRDGGDLTGSTITSTKSIAFFSGHTCAQVPGDVNFYDMLLESEPPMNDWGREFIIPKFEGKDYSVVRIIAGSDSTRVFVDGKPFTILKKATDYCEIDTFYHVAIVSTSKPALVAQYCSSTDADTVKIGDPFMLFIVPIERFVTDISTSTMMPGSWWQYLTIVVPDSGMKSLKIDGALVGINGKYPVGTTLHHTYELPAVKMRTLSIAVSEGRHSVECAAPVGVYSYGFGVAEYNYDSYGHNCGMRLGP